MTGKKKEDYKSYTDEYKRNGKFLLRYGITLDYFNELFNKQMGRCAICKTHQMALSRRLCLDHNHDTGQVRGLLCNKCNIGLGKLGDNINLIKVTLKYLVYYPTKIFKFSIKGYENKEDIPKRKKTENQRKLILWKEYKMSLNDYNGLSKCQNDVCAICNKPNNYTYSKKDNKLKPLSIDHNHRTNQIRGLLCDSCNTGLGLFCDSDLLLKSAIKYLESYESL